MITKLTLAALTALAATTLAPLAASAAGNEVTITQASDTALSSPDMGAAVGAHKHHKHHKRHQTGH